MVNSASLPLSLLLALIFAPETFPPKLPLLAEIFPLKLPVDAVTVLPTLMEPVISAEADLILPDRVTFLAPISVAAILPVLILFDERLPLKLTLDALIPFVIFALFALISPLNSALLAVMALTERELLTVALFVVTVDDSKLPVSSILVVLNILLNGLYLRPPSVLILSLPDGLDAKVRYLLAFVPSLMTLTLIEFVAVSASFALSASFAIKDYNRTFHRAL